MDGEKFNFLQAKHYYLDAPKEPRGTCFVLQADFARIAESLSDEWSSNDALMSLLADEKRKSEALEARCRELEEVNRQYLERLRELKTALREYGKHAITCTKFAHKPVCTCGLDAVRN